MGMLAVLLFGECTIKTALRNLALFTPITQELEGKIFVALALAVMQKNSNVCS